MPNHANQRDESQIKIYEVQELRYWTKKLGVSSDALISAVRAVGPNMVQVREYLRLH